MQKLRLALMFFLASIIAKHGDAPGRFSSKMYLLPDITAMLVIVLLGSSLGYKSWCFMQILGSRKTNSKVSLVVQAYELSGRSKLH